MIYLVTENLLNKKEKFINGGKKHSVNLLKGLNQLKAEIYIINIIQENKSDKALSIKITDSTYGKLVNISGLPKVKTWRDSQSIEIFNQLLDILPDVRGIFHLRDIGSYLGSWLAALQPTQHKIVFQAVDYAWLCMRSHLLDSQGIQCSGPKNTDSCLQCFYSHREPLKSVALKTILNSTYLPQPLQVIIPNKIKPIISSAKVNRIITETRLENLNKDFARVDAIIAHSQILSQLFISNGFPQEKMFHVPTGIERGNKISHQERPSLDKKIIFGYAGKLTFDKGLDILIQALSELRKETSIELNLIVYSKPHASGFGRDMMKLINTYRWISLSQYNGSDPNSIDTAHRQINFQVSPSRWTDNLPNSVLEGIERNTPVIAPNHGCFPEMIVDGVNGCLYPKNTVQELKNILEKIINNPQNYAQLPFDNNKVRSPIAEAEDILKIYQKLLPLC